MKPSVTISSAAASYSLDIGGFAVPECKIAVEVLEAPGGDAVREVLSGLVLRDDGDKVVVSAQSAHGPVEVVFEDGGDSSRLAIRVHASIDLKSPVRFIELSPVFGVSFANATHLFSHGRSMGGCKTCKLPAAKFASEIGEEDSARFKSYFQTMVSFGKRKLHVTQPLRQRDISTMTGAISGDRILDFSATTRFEGSPAGRLETVVTTFAVVEDGFKALCGYGDENVEVKPPAEPQPIGWNSWDYYRWTISEEETLRNADFIATDPVLSKYVKRIIVDDGWQYCYGEWDANSLFPSGMPSLAKNLRKMGFTPGLWIAPLIAEPHSRIAQWETDMLAMSEGGDPCLSYECMRRYGFIIDPTVEKSQKFWYDLFTRYADYGFGYFKIDFLMPLFSAPRFHDNSVPRGELLRKVISPIHQATQGRATVLGCGYGYEAGTDMIHMVRAGGDIHATWSCARNNAVAVAARAWASNRLWVTDPDFCVCRGPETSKDPDIGRLRCLYVFVKPTELSRGPAPDYPWSNGLDSILAGEARCLLSTAIMNGGALNLSDKLYQLNDVGLDLVRRTVSAERGSAPVPVDFFESDIAAKWIQKTPSGFRVLLVNWGDEPCEYSLDYGALGYSASKARDFWTDEVVEFQGNIAKAALAPHSCRLFEFR